MKIERLVCSQFRCWSYRDQSFPGSIAYIQGPNGSGKTSLLEAIAFLSNGRSFLTHKSRECIQHDHKQFSLRGEFVDAPVDSISMRYQVSGQSAQRLVKVDDEPLQRLSQLQDKIATLYFHSDDLLTLRKGPSRRRRLLNEVLSRTDPGYIQHLQHYQKARKQRNSVLKGHTPDDQLLDSLEQTMSDHAKPIVETRAKLFPQLQPLLREEHKKLVNQNPGQLNIVYQPDLEEGEQIYQQFQQERPRAKQRGYTTIGPQRDDWQITIDGREAGTYASRGELRTLVFALKFALSEAIMDSAGQWPILLFDDMVSDLDQQHIRKVLKRADKHPFQLIFTGTRPLGEGGILPTSASISVMDGE